jgi:hypothetical protein
MAHMVMNFEEWLVDLADIARNDGAGEYVIEAGRNNFIELYDQGLLPDEAWQAEKDAVGSMGL